MLQIAKGKEIVPGYRLLERIGHGQFGEVWRASGPGGTLAALKIIEIDRIHGWKELRGIRRVITVVHPHIMPVTSLWLVNHQGEVLDDDAFANIESLATAKKTGTIEVANCLLGWLVVAMPLGERDLLRRLQECEGQGLPLAELMGHMRDAAKGIDFLHTPRHDLGQGPVAIRHGDIKPANMMLIGGAIQLCDFGLSKLLGTTEKSSQHSLGTPAYLPPECLSVGNSHANSDQYSLAISYCELRTGRLPFVNLSYHEVLDAHLKSRLDLAGLTESERQVVRRATSLDPAQRFDSCWEFVDALEQSVAPLLRPALAERAAAAFPSPRPAPSRSGTEVPLARPASAATGVAAGAELVPDLEEGVRLYHIREFPRAIQMLTAAIEQNPEQPEGHLYRGDAHFELGEYLEAIQDYTVAMTRKLATSSPMAIRAGADAVATSPAGLRGRT